MRERLGIAFALQPELVGVDRAGSVHRQREQEVHLLPGRRAQAGRRAASGRGDGRGKARRRNRSRAARGPARAPRMRRSFSAAKRRSVPSPPPPVNRGRRGARMRALPGERS